MNWVWQYERGVLINRRYDYMIAHLFDRGSDTPDLHSEMVIRKAFFNVFLPLHDLRVSLLLGIMRKCNAIQSGYLSIYILNAT
jgi:hypothetical protein